MTQKVKAATAINRTYLGQNVPMGADFDSDIADHKNMPVGMAQVFWSGNDAADGTFELWVSGLPEPETFTYFTGSRYTMNADLKALLWNVGVIGYRYCFVRYKANSVTTGTMSFIALAKGGFL